MNLRNPALPISNLRTEQEVLDDLRSQVASTSQTEVAAKFAISTSQLNDLLHQRRGFSSAVLRKLGLELVKLYRRV